MTGENVGDTRQFASPPCSLHELDPEFAGLSPRDGKAPPTDLHAWRKTQRKFLIEARLNLGRDEWTASSKLIADGIEGLIGEVEGKVVAAYWPFRGEPDLRSLLKRLSMAGAITALPVVIRKSHPLAFREWRSGEPLERGVWNIPFPAHGTEVVPDIVIAPVVGFDSGCYRLGYGGGFFDRTLASLTNLPTRIGVGYSAQRLETIHPQPYDIPMEMIVTETEVVRPL